MCPYAQVLLEGSTIPLESSKLDHHVNNKILNATVTKKYTFSPLLKKGTDINWLLVSEMKVTEECSDSTSCYS